jgi:hypothetical protein
MSRHVRFTPKSGHSLSVLECPLCAKSRHMQCNKKCSATKNLYSIVSLAASGSGA